MEKSRILDRIDSRILFELDSNARKPISEICRTLRLGRDIVAYRIEKLQRAGILKKCMVIIDPAKLGLTVYKVYLKVESSKKKLDNFIKYLSQSAEVFWLAECYGRWDLVFSIFSSSVQDAEETISSIFQHFPAGIVNYSLFPVIECVVFPRVYNGSGRKTSQVRYGFDSGDSTLDQIELGVITALSSDARMTIVDLAHHLSTTPIIVKNRLDRLEKDKIIVGYRTQVDLEVLGMMLFKIQMYPISFDRREEGRLLDFCANHPNILCFIRQLGECRIEIEVETGNYSQFHEIVDIIRNEFSGLFRSMDHVLIRRDHFHRIPTASLLGSLRNH